MLAIFQNNAHKTESNPYKKKTTNSDKTNFTNNIRINMQVPEITIIKQYSKNNISHDSDRQ